MANDSSAGPDPGPERTRKPPSLEAKESEATAAERGGSPGSPRLGLTATVGAERRTLYEGDSPWQAMHHLSLWVNQDSSKSRDVTEIAVADRAGGYGAVAQRNDNSEFELRFETPDAQALYRQVTRERQMELGSPANNRISAAAPERATAPRRNERAGTEQGPSSEDLRRDILARLQTPDDQPSQNEVDRSRSAIVDQQVLERATSEQLKQLQQVARNAPEQLDMSLRELQRKIERDVSRDSADTGKAQGTASQSDPIRVGPSVNERFTVQERLGRRNYWQRDRPDRLSFTETWLSLQSKEHSAAALMGMVDRAVELGWKRLHLDGTPEFKREAWIIATSRGLVAVGHTPTIGDRESAQIERRRLMAPERDRGPAREAATEARSQVPRAKVERVAMPSTEQLRQLVRKAIADGRVSPDLEERLTRLLEREVGKRAAQRSPVALQTWDSAAPRVRAKQQAVASRGSRDVQRDR